MQKKAKTYVLTEDLEIIQKTHSPNAVPLKWSLGATHRRKVRIERATRLIAELILNEQLNKGSLKAE